MQILHSSFFRQQGNPTQILRLYENNGFYTVEMEVVAHKFMDDKSYTTLDMSYQEYESAKHVYDKMRQHLEFLSDVFINELNIDTGEELPED